MKESILIEIHESPRYDVYQRIMTGLRKTPKVLPYELAYDERGSRLFEQICAIPDYYLFRTEYHILQTYAKDITTALGEHVLLVEYGSGNSQKTRILLDHLSALAGYVPIDISREILQETAQELSTAYPSLHILPVCADYTTDFTLPSPTRRVDRRVAYFAGSNIGMMSPNDAEAFLARIRHMCGSDGGLLIGVDLKKEPDILLRAYHNSLQREFVFNMLEYLNREWDATFNPVCFQFLPLYNGPKSRVEGYLVSCTDQVVHIGETAIHFALGEQILFVHLYKYSVEAFAALAARAGWRVKHVWVDENKLFSVQYLTTMR